MKVKIRVIGLTALVLFFALTSAERSFAQESPLVDGDCGEYSRLKATSISVSKDVELRLYQDKYYVWMCYGYLDGSFGTVDIKIKTDALPATLNLHVSAQIGEWLADKPEAAPKNPESEIWWNAVGWTANPVWINGMDTSGEKPRYRFKNAKAREIQLSKSRFGRGKWTFSMEIRSIKGGDGKFYNVVFPKEGEFYSIKVT